MWTFLSCIVLLAKKSQNDPRLKVAVVRPILSKDFGSRSQVSSHLQNNWIMVYQCHLTKFCILRSLTSGVAFQLLDIFLVFGEPCILFLEKSASGGQGFIRCTCATYQS